MKTNKIIQVVPMMAFCLLLSLSKGFSASGDANANPPERLSYQGYLTDSEGVALGSNADGTSNPTNYNIIFRIYDEESDSETSTLLWSETQTVTIDTGVFSVLLGEGEATSSSEPYPTLSYVWDDPTDDSVSTTASDRFIGITVDGFGDEIAPRLQLMTSPYAFLAGRAVVAEALVGTAFVIDSSTGNAQIENDLEVTGQIKAGSDVSIAAESQLSLSSSSLGKYPLYFDWNSDDTKYVKLGLESDSVFGFSSSEFVTHYLMDKDIHVGGTSRILGSGGNLELGEYTTSSSTSSIALTIDGSAGDVAVTDKLTVGGQMEVAAYAQFGGQMEVAGYAQFNRVKDLDLRSTTGSILIGDPSGLNLGFDSNEIMARNNGSTSTLYLNAEGGTVEAGADLEVVENGTFGGDLGVTGGISAGAGLEVVENGTFGGTLEVEGKVHLSESSSVSLTSGSGALMIGDPNGQNMGFDSNEIGSRNNGATATLYLNYDGGTVDVGDKLNVHDILTIYDDTYISSADISDISIAVFRMLNLKSTFNSSTTLQWVVGMERADDDADLHFLYHDGSGDWDSSGYMNANGSGFSSVSDRKFKKDIEEIGPGVLDKLMTIPAVRFHLNRHSDEDPKQIGFIAQDVDSVFPEVVDHNEDFLGLSYARLGVLGIAGLQELRREKDQQIETLRKEKNSELELLKDNNQRLEEENQKLKTQFEELMSRMDAIEKRMQ